MPTIPSEINSILSGKRSLLPDDFTLSNFRKLAKIDIFALNTDEFIKFNTFFTEFFDNLVNIAGIESNDILPIYQQIFRGISRFEKLFELDENYGREIESLTALFNSISKSQVFITFPLAHDHIAIYQQLGMALTTSLRKQVGYKTDFSLESYFSAALESMRDHTFLIQEYETITKWLFKIGNICFAENHCNHELVFNNTLSLLGDVTRELEASGKSSASKAMLRKVLALQKEAAKQLTPNQITEASYLFLNNAYPGQNVTTIARKCETIFPNHCHFLPEPTITSTSAPSISVSGANSTLSTLTFSSSERTEVTTLTMPSSLTENTTHLATHTASSTPDTTSASEIINAMLETAALGFLTGATAEIIDQLPRHNKLWKFAKIILSIPLPILHAYLANLVQNVDNPEEALNIYKLLISCSMVLGIKVLLPIADSLVKKYDLETYVKPVVLPIGLSFYTFWQNPLSGSVNYVSAIAGILSVRGIKKATKATWSFFTKAPSENTIELNKRPSSIRNNSTVTEIHLDPEKQPFFLSDPAKICYFIKEDKFNELKERFAKLLLALTMIHNFYTDEIEILMKLKISTPGNSDNLNKYNSFITRIGNELSKLQALETCLKEEQHLKACVSFSNAQELVNNFESKDENDKDSTLKILHGLFTAIQTQMANFPTTLAEIKGTDCGINLENDSEEALNNASIATKLTYALQTGGDIINRIQRSLGDYNIKNSVSIYEKNTPLKENAAINNNSNRQSGAPTFYKQVNTLDFTESNHNENRQFLI